MKTKLYFILLAAWMQFSCSDLLELHPLDKVSSGTFWKTETDFENALAACYGSMQHEYFSFGLPCWDNMTDNSYGQFSFLGGTIDIVTGNINPTTSGYITVIYTEAYKAITRINIFLQNLKDFTGLSEAKKKQGEAEAKMLRAFFYSHLYRCYGDVPIASEPLNQESQFMEKSPKTEVLNFLMSDIDFAIANLKNETYAESKGRWTVNAAKAYKARMLLYDAYDSNGNAIVSQMNAVKELLSSISGYRLADEFSDNFHDLLQEACPEIMFSIKFLAPNNYSSGGDVFYAIWVAVSPTANLISEFDMADGTPGTPVPYSGNGIIDQTLFTNASLDEREPRAAKTFFIEAYRVAGKEIPNYNRPLGSGMGKFLSPNLEVPYVNARSQQDWIILRYADVLLMLAEAENEINGPTDIVYNAINDIRKRGGTSLLPEGLNKNQMRERIRHERRIELAFEGQRYFDLKRWKIAKQVLNNVKDGLLTYKFEDRHYLWPLPQAEIDKANGVLIQNPDYQ